MNSDDLEKKLFHRFLIDRFKPNSTVGVAADCWLVYMDRLLTPGVDKEEVWPKIEKLINIYYDALDANKTGKKVEVGKDLKVFKYPHFMERNKDKDFKDVSYHSSSILGLIYDKVKAFQAEKLQSTQIEMLPCLDVEVPKDCMDNWKGLYDAYSKEMSEALGLQEKDTKNMRCQEIIDYYKKILYEAEEFREIARPKNVIENEAVAIYKIAYRRAKMFGVEKCGFAWKVAGRVLCRYYFSLQDDDDMFDGNFRVINELRG